MFNGNAVKLAPLLISWQRVQLSHKCNPLI